MVPVDAWLTRPIRMRSTQRRVPIVVRVITAFKKIIIRLRRNYTRFSTWAPLLVRRVLKPWANGPP